MTLSGSPGTLINVRLSPTFFARSDITLFGGDVLPGSEVPPSPIMIVTAV
jgi:hypothetical protein